jgi:hypothetical protein
MSTSAAPAGWHPDPANPSGALRWWNGVAWTDHIQQPVATGAAPASMPVAQTPVPYANYENFAPNYAARQVPRTFVQRNSISLTAMAVVAVYIVIALSTRVVLLGVFPVLLSVRAIRRKEVLAPFAVGAAVIAIGVAFLALA